MTFDKVAQNLTREVYSSLRKSLELGKWPDGRVMSREQKEICMEAIITYEIKNNVPEEERVGYLNREKATSCSAEVRILH